MKHFGINKIINSKYYRKSQIYDKSQSKINEKEFVSSKGKKTKCCMFISVES